MELRTAGKRISRRFLFIYVVFAILVTAMALPAWATNGYFTHGYGVRYKALAGTGAALYLSPMAAATNPGAMTFVGTGYDVSLSVFNPNRQYTVTGDPSMMEGTFGLAPGTYKSDSKWFVIPTIAANWLVGEDESMSIGVAIYGHGGMNTNYPTATFDPQRMFENTSPTGVDLSQMFFIPTFAFVVAESHGFGVSPVVAYQRFEAKGLEAFGAMGFSSAPGKLTNKGHSSSAGYGLRVGYLGGWLDYFSFGAAFQTKTKMGKFDDYAGLFAEQGGFDIPASWTAGVALGFTGMGIAVDVQQILYSDVRSIANPLLPNLQEALLGNDDGAGFGWRDMTIIKTGGWYRTNSGWMFRAGYSYGEQPIPESEMLFNILAPGVIEQHLTFGVSKYVGSGQEITLALSRGLSKSISGPNTLEIPGQQTIELKMDQWELGFGVSF
jgi:long-chain fatty acid transport protein